MQRMTDHSCVVRSCCVQFIEVSFSLKINSCLDCFFYIGARKVNGKFMWRFPDHEIDETKWIWGERRGYEPGTPQFTAYLDVVKILKRSKCINLKFQYYPPNSLSFYVKPQLFFTNCTNLAADAKPSNAICLGGNANMIKAAAVFATTSTNAIWFVASLQPECRQIIILAKAKGWFLSGS